jgi:uncharacterized membrane protein
VEIRFAAGAESALGLLQRLQKEELITINDAAYVYWPMDRKKPKIQPESTCAVRRCCSSGGVRPSPLSCRSRAV